MVCWDPRIEEMPKEELRRMQYKLLKSLVYRLYSFSPFYHDRMKEQKVHPDDIRELADVRKLPFMFKRDLRDNYPDRIFTASQEELVRYHVSSGTTGKPTVVGYSRNDLNIWSELVARFMTAAGVTADDIVHIAFGYGLFTGAFGLHYGAEKIGASVIPISGGNTKRQIMIMQDFGSTVLTCTPSYSLYLAEEAAAEGVDIRSSKLRVGIFGAEPWSEAMRAEIEANLGLDAIDIYGLSEIMGPGVAIECIEAKQGLHIWEDHFIPEIINPETGQPVADGEKGELVITTITKQGIPLIRYRTRDITSIDRSPCICGRTHGRIARLSGRSDDMLIIRGVNVFPSQIESILVRVEGVEPHYLLIVDRKDNLDTLEVQVEVNEQMFSDEIKVLQSLARRIEKEIKDMLGVTSTVKLVEPKTIQRSEGKAKRVQDNRKL